MNKKDKQNYSIWQVHINYYFMHQSMNFNKSCILCMDTISPHRYININRLTTDGNGKGDMGMGMGC